MTKPLVVINTVGLTARHLALSSRFRTLAENGWARPLQEVFPAVTCTAQATLLTGTKPDEHGIVGNGWFWRETGEVRFWLQSNRLIQAEPLYQTALRRAAARGNSFRCAKLFWWFNQGAAVDVSVTPKPHYGADGNKVFDITGTPAGLTEDLQRRLGPFPFHNFWGPLAGTPASEWIARCAAEILSERPPDLSLVYLPHLDNDTQRFGPDQCNWKKLLAHLEQACLPLLDAAEKVGARIWIVNECAHVPVRQAIDLNRRLRKAGFLEVRAGPFGEMLDTFASRAFAVCDHQIAHLYVRESEDVAKVCDLLLDFGDIDRVLAGAQRGELHLDHPRAGDVVALANANAWFAYPYWFEDALAPDFARTVNIHAKPGYDPCELFLDPKRWLPKGRMLRRLVEKKMGFRTLFDVVPLDPSLVKGSHGLVMADPKDKPVLIGDGPAPSGNEVNMTDVKELLLAALELAD